MPFFGTPCSMFPFAHAILCLIQHERNWIKRLCQRSLGTLQAFEDAQEDALVFPPIDENQESQRMCGKLLLSFRTS